jgi:hypothetical protein
MTASPADLLPDLDRLAADIAGLAGGPERSLAALLSQAAADLATRGQALATIADSLDAATVDAAATLADLRAKIGAPPQPAPARKPKLVGRRSGLPWADGARFVNASASSAWPAQQSLEALRGRPLDFQMAWIGPWDAPTAAQWVSGAVSIGPSGIVKANAARGIPAALSIPPWPKAETDPANLPQAFRDCAAGRWDATHQALIAKAKATGATIVGLRPMWEGDYAGYPWAFQNAGDPGLYKAAFAHIAFDLWGAAFPTALISQNFLRAFGAGSDLGLADVLVPGVDCLGADLYGNDPRVATAAGVAAYMAAGTPDRPAGPRSWADAARANGLWLDVWEWGPTNTAGPGTDMDSDYYVRAMWDFFVANAADLNLVSLFDVLDGTREHRLDPPTFNPRASAAYQACWRPMLAQAAPRQVAP